MTEERKKRETELLAKCPKVLSGLQYQLFAIGDGWFSIVEELTIALEALPKPPVCVQIKEKIGGLRYYLNGADVTAQRLVTLAEIKAGRTCEECGDAGRIRRLDYIQTLCDSHYQKALKVEED